MGNQVDLNSSGVFDGAATLLKFGPLGLSGLLLVLGISVFFIRLDAPRERLMRQFLYVGAALSIFFGIMAFLPTLISPSSHQLHLSVQPLDTAVAREIPRPILTVNNTAHDPPLNILVDRELTAILDISEALEFVQRLQATVTAQSSALSLVERELQPATRQVAVAQQILADAPSRCPIGISWDKAALVEATESASDRLQQVTELIGAAIARGP